MVLDVLSIYDVLFRLQIEEGCKMTSYAEQIAIEKQKIAMFQSKIEQCQKRILSLEFLMADSDDALDAFASGMITASTPSHVAASSVPHQLGDNKIKADDNEYIRTPKKRLAENTIKLLKQIGIDGKELKDLAMYSKENNLGMTDQNIRNFAMIYRKQYGFIENPRKGFYRLTEVGRNAIEAL